MLDAHRGVISLSALGTKIVRASPHVLMHSIYFFLADHAMLPLYHCDSCYSIATQCNLAVVVVKVGKSKILAVRESTFQDIGLFFRR